MDRALSDATTQGQSGPGSDDYEGVLRIPQSSSTAGTSPSDCLVSYPGHSLVGVLPLCRGAVSVFYSPSWLGKQVIKDKRKDNVPPTKQALVFLRRQKCLPRKPTEQSLICSVPIVCPDIYIYIQTSFDKDDGNTVYYF